MNNLLSEAVVYGQDFEWYPTTDEIIEAVFQSIKKDEGGVESILDIGAGDGRVLKTLAEKLEAELDCTPALLAMERSVTLLNALPAEIGIVGTNFYEQTLTDKEVGIIFCNPPYSDYANWMAKIITEANCFAAYLVVPQRWKTNESVLAALKYRGAVAKVIGSFDFSKADRKARAKVDLVRIDFGKMRRNMRFWDEPEDVEKHLSESRPTWKDPFDAWFDEHFGREDVPEESAASYEKQKTEQEQLRDRFHHLVKGRSVIDVLEELYQQDMQKTIETYRKVCDLDARILDELNIDMSGVRASLKARIKGLKNLYWQELFSNFESITSRLTSKTRKAMLDKLNEKVTLEFTASNAYAIAIWAIKNANQYYDQQLVQVFEQMIEEANVKAYKSNQKTFQEERWRFNRVGERPKTPCQLEYRVIVSLGCLPNKLDTQLVR